MSPLGGNPPGQGRAACRQGAVPTMQGKILIVDDSVTNRIVLKVKLSSAYYDTRQTRSAAEALAAVRGGLPDLVVVGTDLPDADAVATRLAHEGADLALVTGNLEPIGRAKVAAAGLGHHFAPGGGGFGSDSELRADLVRLARERAREAHADHEVVVVGDTPRDIAAARGAGVRVIGVTTGVHGTEALADADAVVPDLTGALAVLLA